MSALRTWLALAVTTFAGLGAGYHGYLQTHPRQVVVVVDSSYPMLEVWPQVAAVLDDLGRRRYTQFFLSTEKSVVHEWSDRLQTGRITPYAPRDFSRLNGLLPPAANAEVYFLTNAESALTESFAGWHVIRLTRPNSSN